MKPIAEKLVLLWLLISPMGACHTKPTTLPASPSASQDTSRMLIAMAPDEVKLDGLLRTELASSSPIVVRVLELADTLARSNVAYRTDSRTRPLTRAELADPQPALSCTEFVWLVFSRGGLQLGNFHVETKEMAFDPGVYAPALIKLDSSVTVQSGDILIYEYSDRELIREIEKQGHYRFGHAVIVVSPQNKVVIGSHGGESTPPGGRTGVGYRKLLGSWQRWTMGRTLQAVYRVGDASTAVTVQGRLAPQTSM